jgi:hypothetical protein
MAARIRRKEEELRRRRAHRASELAFASRSVGLSDLTAPRPPELARQHTLKREEQTRRAFAAQGQAFGLTVGLGNLAAESAAREVMDGGQAHRGLDVSRSRGMAADVLGRKNDPTWHEDGRYTMRDEVAGLDVVYDPSGGAPDVDLKQVEQGLGGGSPLDGGTREYMEWRFGVSFEKVRIHNSSKAGAISKALFAHAFALGKDVAFAQGNYRPGTKEGDRLLAHELTHVVQAGLAPQVSVPGPVAEGVKKSASVSEPTDHFEVEADAMAAQVVSVSRSEFQKAKREGLLGKDPEETARKRAAAADAMASRSADPVLSRSSAAPSSSSRGPSAGSVSRSSTIRREGDANEATEGGGDIKFTLHLLEDIAIEIKGAKAKKPTYTQTVSFPGLKNAKVVLTLADGKVTGGALKGSANAKELTGPVEFSVGTDGRVSGTSSCHWTCKDFGEGEVEVRPLLGQLAGGADVTLAEIKAGSDLVVTDFTGSIRLCVDSKVAATGKGTGSVSEGKLVGPLTLDYATDGGTTGTLKADIEIESFKKAFENGQVTGGGGEPLPKFDLDLKKGKWSGDQVVPFNKGADGMKGQSSVHLKYDGAKFSGTGDGTFDIADFVKGTISNSVTADGKVNGTFKLETKTFQMGAVTCEKIALTGGIQDDVVSLKASGSLSAFDGKAKGSFESNLADSGGLVWTGKASLDIPQMKKAEVNLVYNVGKGVTGSCTLSPSIPAIKGEGTLKYDGSQLSGECEFDVDLPLLNGAKVKAKYEDGKLSGTTSIDAGAVQIPNIQITASSLTATFGDEFSIAGSVSASMAAGQVTGTLNMGYAGGKFTADMSSMFSVPGINPVELKLEYAGGQLKGSASTSVNIPMADEASLTVYYRDGNFGGKGKVGFNVPGLNKVEGTVEITPEGQLNGTLAIKPKDFSIPPLTVEQCDITGAITAGKLSISGGGTVKGIPMTESATLKATYSDAEGFGGTIETQFKVPGLKEAKASLTLKGGEVSGSVSAEAEMAGFTGGVKCNYNAGKWSGSGTLGYKKGKFDGSVTVNLGESGKISGKGSVGYQISDNFKVTAELELREDESMVIGGKIECPDKVELFKKEYEKNLFKMKGRFGIPGLSIQVPVVGVIGLEAQLSGSLDFKAGIDVFLTDITAAGSFDTATGDVDLQLGGTVKGQAHAGIEASARLAVGLGIGPAFIGGYVQVTGAARAEAEIYAGVSAQYKTGGPLKLNFNVGASAGLVLALTISGGITASVDLWVKTLKKDWELASKTWEFRPGGKLEYRKDFDYELGSAPSASMLEPDSTPSIDGNDMAKQAGGQAEI